MAEAYDTSLILSLISMGISLLSLLINLGWFIRTIRMLSKTAEQVMLFKVSQEGGPVSAAAFVQQVKKLDVSKANKPPATVPVERHKKEKAIKEMTGRRVNVTVGM